MNILTTTIIHHENDFYFTFEDSELRIVVPQRYYDIVKDGMKVRVGVRPTDIYVGGPDSKEHL